MYAVLWFQLIECICTLLMQFYIHVTSICIQEREFASRNICRDAKTGSYERHAFIALYDTPENKSRTLKPVKIPLDMSIHPQPIGPVRQSRLRQISYIFGTSNNYRVIKNEQIQTFDQVINEQVQKSRNLTKSYQLSMLKSPNLSDTH